MDLFVDLLDFTIKDGYSRLVTGLDDMSVQVDHFLLDLDVGLVNFNSLHLQLTSFNLFDRQVVLLNDFSKFVDDVLLLHDFFIAVLVLPLVPFPKLSDLDHSFIVLLLVEGVVDRGLQVTPERVARLLLLIFDLDILDVKGFNLLESDVEHLDHLILLL